MRVLLDEMLDRRLKNPLPAGVEVATVQERGWGSVKNGALLTLAEGKFDALFTADRSIPYQQNLSRYEIVVVILEAPRNGYDNLAPLIGRAVGKPRSTTSGKAIRVRERGPARGERNLP